MLFIRSGKTAFFLFILFHFFVYEILPHSQPTELKWLSLKPWGIALKFLFLHHENILFPND
ncbi:hypothetical protein GAZ38_25500 [Bacteroides xylanisolvens]|uniref:Uncharacterized protein n=1 Tax=Bacteroides xylanisolvens TaxID=371601 RepID=A0A7J5QJ88_9BACE|nr:hypothetical protein GAZ38_25500 [Bacteroides xylanisolvens]KAB6364631.1 hypothetical protein GAZ46_25595 [Bacteroides xylanisolvens]KAB6373044.1 hypothetical protein GAZ34_25415 [Bacteroides xylanisolvens]KAB6385889.1 hypothetical protein GAZ23_25365 [Bacteroides xylanisolvens]KAB6390646.1 hypothetical protein GAZ29_25250 [Bacteroides xylanisolvens]